MINSFYKAFNITSPVAGIIISIALMLITGFAMTRITKRLRLPNVTAYILSGVLLGPYVLNLVPENIVEGMDFLNDIALAFIAFSTGEFFRFSTLKKNGAKVVVITVLEACLASVIVSSCLLYPRARYQLLARARCARLGDCARFDGHDYPPDPREGRLC